MPSTLAGTAHGDDQAPDAAGLAHAEPALPARYEALGLIAGGASGEVLRVRDKVLDRVAAMKVLRAAHVRSPRMRARFLVEAEITAELSHPGIVAVHDRGELPDGRLWFTMQEVRGRTLEAVLDELHAGKGPSGFRGGAAALRRVIDAIARVAQAVAHAHGRGIVHRDLKPANVMVGDLGEVLVMDWGLARRIGDAAEREGTKSEPLDGPAASAPLVTREGDVLGTPAYMPPEQARGALHLHGPASDVYALGAILYHALAGKPPYAGEGVARFRAILAGGPTPVVEAAAGGPPPPAGLVAICERAMERDIEARYAEAGSLAAELVGWLDGARRREEARRALLVAQARKPSLLALRARAAGLLAQADAALRAVRPSDPLEKKEPGWRLLDEARALEVDVAVAETSFVEAVHGALSVDPELDEAHEALAEHYRERLFEADRAGDAAGSARALALLRVHDRGRHAAVLRGEGHLSLVTDPPGATVFCERYTERARRLVADPFGELGRTPLDRVALPHGSYRLRIRSPGRREVLLPVLIERAGHWDGRPPGEAEPAVIALPEEGELGSDEVYVPAGYTWSGGDPRAGDGLPGRRIWIDAFVVSRYAVTNEQWLAYLNDLVEGGREEEALAACPRAQLGMDGERMVFARDRDGRFVLGDDHLDRPLLPDAPVVLVDWYGAVAYAAWLAARTGKPYRLLNELEREKAARGVDGRVCPVGHHLDPAFVWCVDSVEKNPNIASVHAHPLDESPYGVRGLGGNTRDYCENAWRRDGPRIEGDRLLREVARGDEVRAVRGGTWTSPLEFCRAATRFGNPPSIRRFTTGVRVGWSYPR
ncbi:bifunctional serine/threonine-protein kinase/formylglycine-generating enzyme family protein [Polyangium aurulentum]|uniref:bifunctional serine/threonine-protein kinase/formylglycine-generating enzyme family protein n=1 Tax=Polyangium aurulentum TaxID=2567896 RepID=UPI00146B63C6|nr:bifunctional serine/threonine-protein kinase/formylglycine-generating enzyme family protein [Polyangium aurulentum]UQA56749.1 SUMF1/EgtB/PvdO family nonheme iron enzyme [Polyangium aurulentum]